MSFKSLYFSGLLLLVLSANAQNQPITSSYIVTKTNDTLYGKIKMNAFTGERKLITADSSYKIDPEQYSAYYDQKHKSLYRSKILPSLLTEKLKKKLAIVEKPDWLKCIEDGRITLYQQKNYTYSNTPDNALGIVITLSGIIATGGVPNSEFTSWYVEKEGILSVIKHNKFASIDGTTRKERKDLLENLIADKISKKNYENKVFSFENVQLLIKDYNSK
ncbi:MULTISPECIES: hypothetical protein [Flavobacterium]|uniref:hypothetical protein n=1 Tax=Flavobacterium TaxID=237 RepID=UPI0011844D1D|nr:MULTISPECIES: hypothetical protein [Flavobacterium]MCR4033804.1 hypothetical protein [Flavobacterium panacis]